MKWSAVGVGGGVIEAVAMVYLKRITGLSYIYVKKYCVN